MVQKKNIKKIFKNYNVLQINRVQKKRFKDVDKKYLKLVHQPRKLILVQKLKKQNKNKMSNSPGILTKSNLDKMVTYIENNIFQLNRFETKGT